MKQTLYFAAIALFTTSCGTDFPPISVDEVLSHIETISADEFQGRAPATKGEDLVVSYIQNEFEQLNMKPAFGKSFIQDVPVTAYKVGKSSSITFSQRKSKNKLNYLSEFMAWPVNNEANLELKNLPLVYVGYGIIAPEENWDDYKGVDVKGKILVFKNSDPYSYSDKFAGKSRLYYGRYTYKYEIAEKLGAAGAIIIHTTPTAGYPWSVVSNSWEKQQFKLKSNSSESASQINGWITADVASKLFKDAGMDLATYLDAAEQENFQPSELKGISFSASLNTEFADLTMKNIGGVISGTDSELKDEYVVFTAHHDHLGIGAPVNGDSVFNGAVDNATGISAMLNLAKLYQKSPTKRSLLFLAVGGEEKGLLGSKYFSENPSVEPAFISANINMDGLNVFGKTTDVPSLGNGRSSIDSILESFATKQGRKVVGDPHPEAGYYYRSDHFNFARIGVPALYLSRGVEFIDKPADYAETVVDPWVLTRYHTVEDEIYDKWDVSGMIQDIQLMYAVGKTIGNSDVMMTWNPGDEFEAIRLNSLKKREK